MEAFSEKAPPAKKLRLGSPKDSFHFSQDCFAHHPDRSAPQHLCDIGHGQDAYEGSRHDALVYAEGIAPSAYEIGPAHAEEGNGRSDEDALVCFGMLSEMSLCVLPDTHMPSTSCRIHLSERDKKIRISLSSEYVPFAALTSRDNVILSSLISCQGVELQGDFLAHPMQTTKGMHKHRTCSSPGLASTMTLSVTIYGPMKWFGAVGDYLVSCNEFLQLPIRSNRNVRYHNPQSLSVPEHDAPMTFELLASSLANDVTDAASAVDPASQLESQHDYEETLAPSCVTTPLYKHQKQALTFMRGREKGWDLFGRDEDIWKADADSFLNAVTGEISANRPAECRAGILADQMGLGKSLTIIALIASNQPSRSQSPCYGSRSTTQETDCGTLIVAPLSLLQTWNDQFKTHLKQDTLSWAMYHPSCGPLVGIEQLLYHDIVIATYETAALQWRAASRAQQPLFSTRWRRIVLDEAHEIRNPASLRAKAVFNLKGHRRWAVTGTPIQNRIDDLASLLLFLRVFPDLKHNALRRLIRPLETDPAIRKLFTCLCLRWSKATVSLPVRNDTIKHVTFQDDEADAYKAINDKIINMVSNSECSRNSSDYPAVPVRIGVLRQICNLGVSYARSRPDLNTTRYLLGPTLESFNGMVASGAAFCQKCGKDVAAESSDCGYGSSSILALISECGNIVCGLCNEMKTDLECGCSSSPSCNYSLVEPEHSIMPPLAYNNLSMSSKAQLLLLSIQDLPPTDKALIFSYWTSTLDMVAASLTAYNVPSLRLDGSMNPCQRTEAIEVFSADPQARVLLMSLRCGSHGLNITAANHVYIMEPQWNPMLEEQAISRVHRIGQTKPVSVTRLVVEGTIEENIRKLQAKKRHLSEQAFAPAKGGREWVKRIQALTQEI